MAELVIYGASDDLIEFDGAFSEEFPSDDAKFVIEDPDGVRKTFVRVVFEENGCWGVTLWPADEDVPMHEGTVKLNDRGYSALVTLTVADGVQVTPLTVHADGEPVG